MLRGLPDMPRTNASQPKLWLMVSMQIQNRPQDGPAISAWSKHGHVCRALEGLCPPLPRGQR